MMSHPLIAPPAFPVALREVEKVYRRGQMAVRALDGISAEFERYSFTAVMGPSGSGKSTLLHCAAGLERPTSGTVWLGGQDLGRLSDKRLTKLRRSRVGFIFQAFNLVPALTVRENVLLPLRLALHVSWLPPLTAVAGVMIVAVVAGWIADLRVSRIRPVEALREAAVERRGRLADVVRASLGLVALASGIVLAGLATHLTASAAAGTAIGLVADLVIAVALLAPWGIRIAVALCAAALRRLGVPGRLAAANLAASARRLSPVLSALVLAVALGGSLWFLQTSIQHATTQQSRIGLLADQVITTAGPGLPVGVAQVARHVPGATAATSVVRSVMFDNQGDEYTAEGVDTAALPGTLGLGTVSGSLVGLYGDTVAVDTVPPVTCTCTSAASSAAGSATALG